MGIRTHAQKKYSFSESKMGSPLNIIIVTNDSSQAVSLSKACYALVDSFNLLYSDYDSHSELSKLNASAGADPKPITQGMLDILLVSQKAYKKSSGVFDITVGSLSHFWRKARKENRFPDAVSLAAIRKQVGFPKLVLQKTNHTLLLPSGMQLDLGGIAKGYIAQKLLDFLTQQGIHQALVDAGGDMVMSGSPPRSAGWTIGVNVPETTDELLPRKLTLQNMAVATSGDAYQYFENNGKKYSHIIDPRTGYGITSQRNVTVIARNGADADWLATACSILPIEEAKKLAVSENAEVLITEMKEGKVVYHASKGFSQFWKKE